MKPTILLTLGLSALAVPATANDTTAVMAAGGLVFTRTQAVSMVSEDLFISAREVRVRYRFLNRTPKDVTVQVAFPMPDITVTESPQGIPTEDPTNIMGFSTLTDGKPVEAHVEQKAFLGKVDHTARLKALGLPLAPHLPATERALDKLSTSQKADLVKRGLVSEQSWDAGKGVETHYLPSWTLKSAYHWQQTFPSGREITVDHRYRPGTGGSAGTQIGDAGLMSSAWGRADVARYCVDDKLIAAVRKTMGPGVEYPPFYEQRVSYILKTGANWAGPIGDFRLTVDKGAPENLVSFCADGVQKVSPTRFEVRKTQFVPRQDLDILILLPIPKS